MAKKCHSLSRQGDSPVVCLKVCLKVECLKVCLKVLDKFLDRVKALQDKPFGF